MIKEIRFAHTEHALHSFVSTENGMEEVELFRAPTVHDGSGTHKRMPHRIKWNEMRAGDVVLALCIQREDSFEAIQLLHIWHVVAANDGGEITAWCNTLVGGGAGGEYVYDRLAELVNAPMSEGPPKQ